MLLEKEVPKNQDLFCVTTSLCYNGNGIAHANLSDIREADDMQNLFKETVCRIPDKRYTHVASCLDQMGVAGEILVGEIAYHAGDHNKAFNHLRESVKEDAIPGEEPWN